MYDIEDILPKYQILDLRIDPIEREVSVKGETKQLTRLEYDLLIFLFRYSGQVFTYRQIYEAVWKEKYAYEKGIIMTHICHLRKKIEEDSTHPVYIENIRGVGYRFIRY